MRGFEVREHPLSTQAHPLAAKSTPQNEWKINKRNNFHQMNIIQICNSCILFSLYLGEIATDGSSRPFFFLGGGGNLATGPIMVGYPQN